MIINTKLLFPFNYNLIIIKIKSKIISKKKKMKQVLFALIATAGVLFTEK